jgi:UDP-N-acetylmuramoyl-tripeptide--D-alanyl-D-alanine ligase
MMNLREAAASGGQVADEFADVRFEQVFSDSRKVAQCGLFIALDGERFDGHDFVKDVLAAGAAAAMVSAKWATQHGAGLPLLVVEDTRLGLGRLAAAWRRRFSLPLIGVTGSNGKTTVKEMCAAILRAQYGEDAVLATAGNLNNDIGLPLTLLRLRPHHCAAVIEIGMNHPGETAELAAIAAPTVGLINNAQREHQEFMKTVAAVAEEHAALLAALPSDGIAVINADDEYAAVWRSAAGARPLLGFGIDGPCEVAGRFFERGLGGRLDIATPRGTVVTALELPGRHNARNACAAVAATQAAGAAPEAAERGLNNFGGVRGRLQRKEGLHGALVIDDTYNANPDSMRAAVDVLAALPGKRVFVIGDMGEVGEAGGQYHDELGGYAKSMGVDRLLCLGELSPAAAHTFGEGGSHYTRLDDLIRALKPELDERTTVLVKGSRFMRMERVVDAISVAQNGEQHAA